MYTIDVIQIYDITMYDIYIIYTYTIYIYIYQAHADRSQYHTCVFGGALPEGLDDAEDEMSSWPKVRTPFPIIYGLPPEFVDAPLLCFVSVRAPAVLSVGGPWQRRGCVEKALVRADALAPHACARARGLASCESAFARGVVATPHATVPAQDSVLPTHHV